MSRPPSDVLFLRAAFILVLAGFAAILHPFNVSPAIAAAGAIGVAVAVLALGLHLRKAGLRQLIAGWLGVFGGACTGTIFVFSLEPSWASQANTGLFLRLALPLIGAYLGFVAASAKSAHLPLEVMGLHDPLQASSSKKILDTSVLIDGRIADIAEAGFLEGKLIITQFVLHELQLVADSPDSIKRQRGRRGLDIVRRLQQLPQLQIEVSSDDFPSIPQVDLKLIQWAKDRDAKIVTNDLNLNKLAQVQGVAVLNINDLANALRPIVLPGESMRVYVLKEGKEYNQGVAYLDDGTMVVVDNARRHLLKTIDITVTSVLQTTAGKMIFGRYDERSNAATAAQTR